MQFVEPDWNTRMRLGSFMLFGFMMYLLWCYVTPVIKAQDAASGPQPAAPAPTPADPMAPAPAPMTPAAGAPNNPNSTAAQREDVVTLFIKGGVFMIPIAFMSALAVMFTIERLLGLRAQRVLPQELVESLGRISSGASGFDPREAYKVCQRFPSTAATVIQDMLLKVGRPHSEVESTVSESSQREAERLYANVRWITLATAVAPLLGLLGTVWGMVECFQALKGTAAGQAYILSDGTPTLNKLLALSDGIYTALMTTVFGLIVAIPASIAAHLFEGWIQTYMHSISELVGDLMPQIEKYEGRVRFGKFTGDEEVVRAETTERKPAGAK